jgi:hypothetical protein
MLGTWSRHSSGYLRLILLPGLILSFRIGKNRPIELSSGTVRREHFWPTMDAWEPDEETRWLLPGMPEQYLPAHTEGGETILDRQGAARQGSGPG